MARPTVSEQPGPPHLDGARLLGDVERIAALGPRFGGSVGEIQCRELLFSAFSRAGLSAVRYEPFPCLSYVPNEARCHFDDGASLLCSGLQGTASAEARGSGVFLGEGTDADIAAAYASGVVLRGAVAVVRTGVLAPVARTLGEHGIAALVHVGETPDGLLGHFTATFYPPPPGPPWSEHLLPFPGVSVEAGAGRRLIAQLASGGTRLTVRHAASSVTRTAANVVGELPGVEAPHERVVVGAHFDTQRASPGASDNATGLAALLALIRAWRGAGLRRTVVFVAFAAEEVAAWGATHHVRCGEPEAIRGMVNFDAIGAPLEGVRTIIATPGLLTTAVQCAASTGWHAEATIDARRFPFTDSAPFADAGIETCMLWRYPPAHPYYHSAGDLPSRVDASRLREDATAGAAVAMAMARGTAP